MIGFAAISMVLTVALFRNAPPLLTIAAVLLGLGGAVLPAIPSDGLYMPETWAGIFLLLSALAYSCGAVGVAVSCVTIALCARELALPYAVACCGIALYERRMKEVRYYAIGASVFAAYYCTHSIVASGHIQPGDMHHTSSWIALGGWQFVVRTVAMGGWFLLLPSWVAAIGAVLVLASLWGPADRRLKAMVLIYLLGFCVVGQSFNTYWGLMTGPSWALAMVYGTMGLQHLLKDAFGRTDQSNPPFAVGGCPTELQS